MFLHIRVVHAVTPTIAHSVATRLYHAVATRVDCDDAPRVDHVVPGFKAAISIGFSAYSVKRAIVCRLLGYRLCPG